MIPVGIINAIFAARDGDLNSTQTLNSMVELSEEEAASPDRRCLCQKLTVSYRILSSLVKLSENSDDDTVSNYLGQIIGAVTREEYVECINVLRFYGYTLLVMLAEKSWNLLPEEMKLCCRMDMESLFSKSATETTVISEYNSLVNQKAAQCIAAMAIQEWPTKWEELISLCISSINRRFGKASDEVKNCKQTMNEIFVFLSFIGEVAMEIGECMDRKMLYKKRVRISNLLENNICDVFLTIHHAMVSGIVSDNEQFMCMTVTIFRNLSAILDGFIFIEFDVDEFLRANLSNLKRSDIIQTLYNICANVCYRQIKCVKMPMSVYFTNEKVYITKLDRFVRNLVDIGESLSLDCTFETAHEHLQIAQALKLFIEKNAVYLIDNVSAESLDLLFGYLVGRLVLHPSIEIAACAISALAILLRRVISMGEKSTVGEYVNGVYVFGVKFRWLDCRRLLLSLFIRCLKVGNPAVQSKVSKRNSPEILDAFIAEISKSANFVMSGSWTGLLLSYAPIDEGLCIGQLKSFDARFAALRSSVLNCASALASVNFECMNIAVKAIAEIFVSARSAAVDKEDCDVDSQCSNFSGTEKQLQWLCMRYVLFDGVCCLFEAFMFRLRGVVTAACNENLGALNKNPEWMQPGLARESIEKVAGVQAASGDCWINNAVSFLLHLLGVPLYGAHGFLLETRRLDMLSSSSSLLFYNSKPLEGVLEYVVGILLLKDSRNPSKVTKLHKSALGTLVTLCESCYQLVSVYVEPIVQRIRECLMVAESDSIRDFLLESLVSLISCFHNFEAQRRFSRDIIAPHIEGISALVSRISAGGRRSEKLFALLFGAGSKDGDSNEAFGSGDPRNVQADSVHSIHRILVMTHSIIKRCVIPQSHSQREAGGYLSPSGRVYHPLEESMCELLPQILQIVIAMAGMWQPVFFSENEWRKTVLSPGEEEWISLHGYNEAIANEDSLRRIVESVFHIPSGVDVVSVRKCRRNAFLLRQAILRLCGEILSHSDAFKIGVNIEDENGGPDLIREALVEPIKWTSISHVAQFLRFAIIPSGLSIRNYLPSIFKISTERINCEWKALSRLCQVLLETDTHESANSDSETRILHLYYLRVYACIESGVQLLALANAVLRAKNSGLQSCSSIEIEYEPDHMHEIVMDGTSNDAKDNFSLVFSSRELLSGILQCLCSAICWPYHKSVTESFRLLRCYAKVAPSLDAASVRLAEHFSGEALLFLHDQINKVDRRFDPLNFGDSRADGANSAYKRFWSNTRDGSNNYIKEFVSTIYAFYECVVKCQPQISQVIQCGTVNVQKLLTQFTAVVESIRLLKPYLQEDECLEFLQKVISQRSSEARTMLQAAIEDYKMNPKKETDKLGQFAQSALETKSAIEIELPKNGDLDGEFFGSDILYLLFE